MSLVEAVYAHSAALPDAERYGLVAQVRRAAVSIPSNVAEGAARRSTREYLRFLSVARGSLAELDTQCQLAERLGMAAMPHSLREQINSTFAQITALMNALERKEIRDDSAPMPNQLLEY